MFWHGIVASLFYIQSHINIVEFESFAASVKAATRNAIQTNRFERRVHSLHD